MKQRLPVATYRVQLSAAQNFGAVQAQLPRLKRLGISHVYLSPVYAAAEGSDHGYDWVAPEVSATLGGETGLRALLEAGAVAGLGFVLDIVPNHCCVQPPRTPAYRNAWWWDVLKRGASSPYVPFFDLNPAGLWPLALPLLDRPLEVALVDGTLEVVPASAVWGETRLLRVYDRFLPLRAEARPHLAQDSVRDADVLATVLAAQHYTLVPWQQAAQRASYRRFFNINELAALDMEHEAAFAAVHEPLRPWVEHGLIEGLRVDHVDALPKPHAYLRQLRSMFPHAWLLVEKIVAPDEHLPPWPVAGTTGYEVAGAVCRVLGGGRAEGRLRGLALRSGFGRYWSWSLARVAAKEAALERAFEGDFNWALRDLATLSGPETPPERSRVLAFHAEAEQRGGPALLSVAGRLREYLTVLDRYRSYLADGDYEELTRHSGAIARGPATSALSLGAVATSPRAWPQMGRTEVLAATLEAKGIEDTLLYRDATFLALADVGCTPRPDVACSLEPLFAPGGLGLLASHDAKRSGDARARLLALAETLGPTQVCFDAVFAALPSALWRVERRPVFGFLLKNYLAAFPISEARFQAFALKAMREAKVHTTWREPNAVFEREVAELVRWLASDGRVLAALHRLTRALAPAEMALRHAMLVLHLLAARTPDIYQGTEGIRRMLTDPDNRDVPTWRAQGVSLVEALAALQSGTGSDEDREGRAAEFKAALTSTCLRLRRALLARGANPVLRPRAGRNASARIDSQARPRSLRSGEGHWLTWYWAEPPASTTGGGPDNAISRASVPRVIADDGAPLAVVEVYCGPGVPPSPPPPVPAFCTLGAASVAGAAAPHPLSRLRIQWHRDLEL